MLPLNNSEHPLSLFTFLKRRKAWTHVLINTMGSCHVRVLSDSWINCWSTKTQATIICKKWPVSKCYYHSGFTDWNFSTIEFSRFPIKQWWRQELTNEVQIPQFIIEQIFPLKCWVSDWTYKQASLFLAWGFTSHTLLIHKTCSQLHGVPKAVTKCLATIIKESLLEERAQKSELVD